VKETEGGDTHRYAPKSDLSLTHPKFGPLDLVEVQSDTDQPDQWCMLLQAMAACRYANIICKPEEEPRVIAIFLDNDHRVHFYYVVFDQVNDVRQLVSLQLIVSKNRLIHTS
jgi:hypothetical protein